MQLPNVEGTVYTYDERMMKYTWRCRTTLYCPVSDCLPFIRPAESKNRLWPVNRTRLFIVYNNWEKQINVIGFQVRQRKKREGQSHKRERER